MIIASIDLETLGTATNAVIASIGCCIMNEHGDSLDVCKIKIDINQPGRVISSSTLAFWLNQSKHAQKLTFATSDEEVDSLLPLHIALIKLADFLKKYKDAHEFYVWGNPSVFDIGKLDNAYTAMGSETPWEFWQVGDMRTLKLVSTDRWREIPFEGEKHCCLADAIHQAKVILCMLKEHPACL